jgi:phosphoserine phosphatase
VKSEINTGRVGFSLIGTAFYWFARYAAGYGDGAETAGRDAAAIYKGEEASSLGERIREFFRMELAHRTRPGYEAVLRAHKENEERCVMCTSTWQHPAEIGAQIYGLETGDENIVSSIMGVDENGVMDGTIQVVAYGDGKFDTTKRWCDANNVDLKDCYFYTDSFSDVKLLEHVGYPVCVNPDARLKKHAIERGWPVVDWGKSEAVLKKPRYSYACLTCSA